MNNVDNLRSYDDVENLERFDEKTLAEYIDLKMKSAEDDAYFIIENIATQLNVEKLFACEIGAGNGKLMYLLEKKQKLKRGINYEVSTSRYKFAEVMKKCLGSKIVENYNVDVLKVSYDNNEYDCIIAVDMVTQIITSLYDKAEEEYFSWINRHLKIGGGGMLSLK